MVLSYSMSALVSSVVAIGIFSGMQLYRQILISSGPMTILGGALGSFLFTTILTAVGNMELVLFGPTYQTGLFPEVVTCLLIALLTCGRIHGVCMTTCLMFSLVSLYYINRVSQKAFNVPSVIHHQKRK